jgi:hypothetical protein
MQAAVVSILLMAGACGDAGEPLPPPPAINSAAPSMMQSRAISAVPGVEQLDADPACIPSATFHGAGSGAYFHTWAGGHLDNTPVWFLHDSAVYYPGNYAEPYDYREIFNYPWHGPRPPVRGAFAPPEFTSRRTTSDARSTYR